MSLFSMIMSANSHVAVKYVTEAVTTGGQITKVWHIRYASVPCRRREMTIAQIAMLYDRAKIDAESIFYLLYRPGILMNDELWMGAERFFIQKITDPDMQHRFLEIAAKKVD